MNEFLMFILLSISYIFLTSSLTKLLNIQGHFNTVLAYKIIPYKSTKLFVWTETLFELGIGSSLLLLINLKYSFLGGILLLVVYCIAITINLIRGRTDIDCGCGGLLGDSKISFKLVFRNLIMVAVLILLLLNIDKYAFNYNKNYFLINSILLQVVLVMVTLKGLKNLHQTTEKIGGYHE